MRIDPVKLAQRALSATRAGEGLETLGAVLTPKRSPVVRGVWRGQEVGTEGTALWVVQGAEWVIEETFSNNVAGDALALVRVDAWRKARYEAMLLPLGYDDDQIDGGVFDTGLTVLCALDAMTR